MKEKILKIINETLKDVDGIENFIAYLNDGTDFFTAPSSTIFHGNKEGGLAEHSLNVYELLVEEAKISGLEYKPRTLTICGLFHDICKTNFYKKSKKWDAKHKQETGRWREIDCYEVEDLFPVGHGEKSVMILQRFIKLTDEEMIAIRWHMMAFDAGIHFQYPSGFPFKKACKENKLLTLLVCADMKVSNLLEEIKE